MKADKKQIDQILRLGGGDFRVLLLYGPDEGLARERLKTITHAILGDDLNDPFRLIDLNQEVLVKDVSRLNDEMKSIAMTGGRKLIRVEASDSLAPVLMAFLTEPKSAGEALLMLTGGDLAARSPLRKIIEQSPDCAAIPCYKDSAADITQLIKKQLSEAGLSLGAPVLAYIAQSLGEDRGVTRAEVEKLILFAGEEKKEISLEEAVSLIGNRAAFALDDLYFAITDGDPQNTERYLSLNIAETSPLVILRGLGKHVARLHLASTRYAQGEQAQSIIGSLRPPLFWTVKSRFEMQMRKLSPHVLARLIDKINGAEADILRHYALNNTLLRNLVFSLLQDIQAATNRS